MSDVSSPMDNMAERRKVWPVFALILDMPNAAVTLEEYSMDESNARNYRINAYHILNYLDKNRAKKVEAALLSELQREPGGDRFAAYITMIFNGVPGSGFVGPSGY